MQEQVVREQLEQSDGWSDFLQRFGQPNAFDVFWYYGLEREDGTVAYVSLCVEEDDDEIVAANVVGEFEWLYDLWDNPKYNAE